MTSTALDSVTRLRRIAVALEAGRAPAAGDAAWLASRLAQYLSDAPRGATMDMCLDLAAMPGEVNWWTAEAAEARDDALREMAARFYHGRRVASQAYKIERLALRYAAAAWRHDRVRDDMPTRYTGTEAACLWTAFKAGATMPLSKRQLQRVLAEGKRADAA